MEVDKIIWLENDEELLNASEDTFLEFGYVVIKCTTVAQALRAINNDESDCLLLDIDFPNNPKEGLVFLQEIRKIKPNIKVVIFTAFIDPVDIVESIRDLAASDYIEKPFPFNPNEQLRFFKRLDKSFRSSIVKSNDLNEDKPIQKSFFRKNREWILGIAGVVIPFVIFFLGKINEKSLILTPDKLELTLKEDSWSYDLSMYVTKKGGIEPVIKRINFNLTVYDTLGNEMGNIPSYVDQKIIIKEKTRELPIQQSINWQELMVHLNSKYEELRSVDIIRLIDKDKTEFKVGYEIISDNGSIVKKESNLLISENENRTNELAIKTADLRSLLEKKQVDSTFVLSDSVVQQYLEMVSKSLYQIHYTFSEGVEPIKISL